MNTSPAQDLHNNNEHISIAEAARMLGVSTSSVRRFEREGKIKSIRKPNGHRVYILAEVHSCKEIVEKERKERVEYLKAHAQKASTYTASQKNSQQKELNVKEIFQPAPQSKTFTPELTFTQNSKVWESSKKKAKAGIFVTAALILLVAGVTTSGAAGKILGKISEVRNSQIALNKSLKTNPYEILGLADRNQNYIFNINVPLRIDNDAEVTGTLEVGEALNVPGTLTAGQVVATTLSSDTITAGTLATAALNGVAAIDETTVTTFEEALDLNVDLDLSLEGDVTGSLQENEISSLKGVTIGQLTTTDGNILMMKGGAVTSAPQTDITQLGTITAGIWQGTPIEPAYLSGVWYLNGNSDTDPLTNFLGTVDNQPLNFRTNNLDRLTIDTNGYVGIGTTTPFTGLHVGNSDEGPYYIASDRENVYVEGDMEVTGIIYGTFEGPITTVGYNPHGVFYSDDEGYLRNSVDKFTWNETTGRLYVSNNLGIGTTDFTYTLNVNGSLNATSLYLNGAQVNTTAAELNRLVGLTGTVLTSDNAATQLSAWDQNASNDLTITTNFNGDVAGTYNNLQLGSGVVTSTEIFDGTILETDLSATNAPSNGQVLTYDNNSGGFTWVSSGSVGTNYWSRTGTNVTPANAGDNISTTGRIGAGTTAPLYALDVNGDVNLTGTLRVNGNQISTANVAENPSYLYFTTARARAAVSASAPLTYNNGTGVFGISQATTSTNGYLSSADWNTFNNKENVLTFTNGLTRDVNSISLGGALAEDVRFYDATHEFLFIDTTNGRVGIGTTSPARTLSVGGAVEGTTIYQNGNQVCDTSGNCAGTGAGMGGVGTANYIAKFSAQYAVINSQLYDNGTNVGIGTTTPLYKLDVQGGQINTSEGFCIDGDCKDSWASIVEGGNGVAGSGTEGYLAFWDGGSSITGSQNLFWDITNGRLGIGTSAPLFALDVAGNVNITGVLNINGSPISTSNIAEGSNLYFTDERVDDRAAALIDDGTGLNWTYNDVLNTLTGNVTLAPFSTTDLAEGSNLYWTQERFDTAFSGKSTTNLTEGTNLYFTDERVDDRVSALVKNGTGLTWSYDDALNTFTGSISLAPFTTDNLAEGASNKYYTDEKARAALSASAPLTYNSTTGAFGITQADTDTDGYLSSIDWNTFNAKLSSSLTQGYFLVGNETNSAIATNAVFLNTANGNFGIGTTAPTSLFSVGTDSTFQVNASGDLVKIKGLTYSWPTLQASTNGQVLINDGSGGLSWGSVVASDVADDSLDWEHFADSMTLDDSTDINLYDANDSSTGNFRYYNSNTLSEILFIDGTNGRVGIGTINPGTYNLNVNGSTNTTSLYLNGTQVTATAAEINRLAGLTGTVLTSDNASTQLSGWDQLASDDLTNTTTFGGDLSGTYNDLQLGNGVVTSTEIADGTILEADINATNAPSDGQILTYNVGGGFTWVNSGSVGTNYWSRTGTTLSPINSGDTIATTEGNSTQWSQAFSWGDHEGLYDLTGTAAGLIGVHETTYDHTKINDAYTYRLTSATDSITGLNLALSNNALSLSLEAGYFIPTTSEQTNWNTAFSWGDHEGLYDLTGTAQGLLNTHESTYNHSNIATAYNHAINDADTSISNELQNLFSTIAINGQTSIAADGQTDTLTFVAGSNITLTTDANNDTITIASSFTDTDTDNYVDNVSFDTGTGDLTLTRTGGLAALVENLDGRYLINESDPQVGVNTTNFLSKWNGTALVSSKIFDNGTNVGIGTTAPTSLLEVAGDIKLLNGTAINEFSTDGTMSGNSDSAVPTEKAIVTYVASAISGSAHPALTLSGTGTYLSLNQETQALTMEAIDLASGSADITGILSLANGGTGSNLSDPNANRIMFWNDTTNAVGWLSAANGVEISGTTIQHTDGSAAVTSDNAGRTYIQDITLDAYGHITGITTSSETVVDTDTDNYVDGVSFDALTGNLTLTRTGELADLIANLDGRYLTEESDSKIGANTLNFLSKWDGTALISSNVFDNGTFVGIGTTSPAATLDIAGNLRIGTIDAASTDPNTLLTVENNIVKALSTANWDKDNTDDLTTSTAFGGDLSGTYDALNIGSGVVGSTELTDDSILEIDLKATNSANGGYILSYDATSGGFTWISNSGGTGASKWTDTGSITYLTATTNDLALGAGTTSAPFFFDVSASALTVNPFGALGGNTGELRFAELSANGSHYTGFKSPDALVSSVIYTLPNTAGTNNYVLTTDGAGALSWKSVSGVGGGTITAVGSMVTGETFNSASADNQWLGLGEAAGRIAFDDQATDYINFLDARVGIGTTAPSSSYLLDVAGAANVSSLAINGTAITAEASEINVLDGILATTSELNVLSGVSETLTSDELSFLDGTTVTNGGIMFGNGTNLTQDKANLFWDSSNKRLGIGTQVPSSALEIAQSSEDTTKLALNYGATPSTTTPFSSVDFISQNTVANFWTLSTDPTTYNIVASVIDKTHNYVYMAAGDPGSYNGTIYACSLSTGCDSADDWTIAYNKEVEIRAMVFDSNNSVLYAAGPNGTQYPNVFRCDTTTNQCYNNNGWVAYAVAINPYNSFAGRMIYVPENQTIYLTSYNWSGEGMRSCVTTSGCDAAGDWIYVVGDPFVDPVDQYSDFYEFGFDTYNNILYMATSDGILYCDTDLNTCRAAAHWSLLSGIAGDADHTFIQDPETNIMYLGDDADIYRCDPTSSPCTTNTRWVKVATIIGIIDTFAYDSDTNVIYAASGTRIYKCATASGCDNTTDWELFNTFGSGINTVSYDSTTQSLFVGLDGGEIYKGSGTAESVTYAQVQTYATDSNLGSEDGSLVFNTLVNGTNTEVLRLAGGNVGIGTTNPTESLDIVGNLKLSGYIVDSLGQAGATGQALLKTETGMAWSDLPESGTQITGTPVNGSTVRYDGTNWTANDLLFNNGTNVGVGTTAPTSLFSVGTDSAFQVNASGDLVKIKGLTYSWPTLQADTNGQVLINDGTGGLTWGSVVASDVAEDSLDWDNLVDAMTLDDSTSINLYDGTASNNFRYYNSNTLAEILFIDGVNGRIGIGTTAPATALDINGVITATGGTSTDWNTAFSWGDHEGLYDLTGTAAGLIGVHETTYDHTKINDAYTYRLTGVTDNVTGLDLSLASNNLTFGLTSGYFIPTTSEQTNWNTAYTHSTTDLDLSDENELQNLFSTITVGATSINADSQTDSLTFIAGDNITLTPNATNGSITVASSFTDNNTTYTAGNGLTLDGTAFELGGALTENTRLYDASHEYLFLNTANGNVGIGTTAPTEKLHLSGNALIDGNLTLSNGIASFTNTSNSTAFTATNTGTGLSFRVNDESGDTTPFVIDASGNVGIGTTTPASLMHISGTSAGTLDGMYIHNKSTATNTGAGLEFHLQTTNNVRGFAGGVSAVKEGDWASMTSAIATVDSGLAFMTMSDAAPYERVRINNLGYMGIGTTAPSQALHVAGNLRLTGHLYDVNNESGVTNQILSRTDTGVDWIALPESGTTIGGSAISGSTVRYNGSAWTADNLLFNNGTSIGIGTTAPSASYKLDINGSANMTSLYLAGTQVTATAAQLNVLSGINATLTSAELNFLDGTTVTNGGIMYGNGTNIAQDTSNLFWDSSNKRLGIGTNSPLSALELAGTSLASTTMGLNLEANPGTSNAFASLDFKAFDFDNTSIAWSTSYDSPATRIISMAFDSTNNIVYAGSDSSAIIYRCATSTGCDAAGDWTVAYDAPASYVNSLLFDSTNNIIYAGTDGGIIFRCATSTGCNGGTGWTTSYSSGQSGVWSFTRDTIDNVVYAGTSPNGIIYRCATSTGCDAAGDWTTSYDSPVSVTYSLTFDTTNGILYAGAGTNGTIYRCDTSTSCDAGSDWTVSYDTPAVEILSLTFDSTNSILYAGANNGSIYRCATSTGCDAAGDWTVSASYGSSASYIQGLIFDSTSNTIYAGTGNNGIIYSCSTSNDCNATDDWAVSYDSSENKILSLTIDSTNNTVYAGSENSAIIYKSSSAYVPSTETYAQIQSIALDTTNGSEDGSVVFKTLINGSSTEAMRISGGNLGIGTTNPLAALSVGASSEFQVSSTGSIAAATGITSSGNIDFTSLNAGGLVKAADTTGRLSLAVAGTDYEVPLTFGNGLTRTTNSVALGGAITGEVRLYDATYEYLFMDNTTGNIGIGTINPTEKLTLDGNMSLTGNLTLSDGIASITNTSASTALTVTNAGAGLSLRVNDESGDASPFAIDASGRVGIGTSSPLTLLQVSGQSTNALESVRLINTSTSTSASSRLGFYLHTSGNNADYIAGSIEAIKEGDWVSSVSSIATVASGLAFRTVSYASEVERMRISNEGYVGIGTTSPAQALDIVGNLKLSGYMVDSAGQAGTEGQLLLRTASGMAWSDLPESGTTIGGSAISGSTVRYNGTAWTADNLLFNNGTSIGIGTTAPSASYKLDINGSANMTSLYLAGTQVTATAAQLNVLAGINATLTSSELNFLDGTTVTNGGIMYGNGTNIAQDTSNLFWDSSNKRLGIGTSSPQATLDVAGDSSEILNASGDIKISAAQNLLLTPAGHVGVGTTAPGFKLDVDGDINLTGTLRVNGSQISTSNVLEGTNLYFTDTRARAALSVSAPLTYNNGTGAFGITQATTSTDGYLSSTDWNTFNSKLSSSLTQGYFLVGDATNNAIASNAVFLDTANGRFGIGTTAPASSLSVGAGSQFQVDADGDIVKINNLTYSWPTLQADTNGQVLINDGNGGLTWGSVVASDVAEDSLDWSNLVDAMTLDDSTSINLYNGTSAGNFRYYNSNTSAEALFISGADGNVGIGTTNPGAYKLNVAGDTFVSKLNVNDAITAERIPHMMETYFSRLTFTSSTHGTLTLETGPNGGIYSDSNVFKISRWGASYFNAGNVGIGTSSPSQKLHVAGNLRLTGHLYDVNNESGTTGQILARTDTGVDWIDLPESGTQITGTPVNGSTVRYDGTSSSWISDNFLFNNGTSLGIGTTAPSATLDLVSSATTGTGALFNFDSLSTGTGLSISSASNDFSTGTLAKVEWSPTLNTIATGDLFSINIGSNGILDGNLFAVYNNSAPVFTVSQTGITSNVPHNFTSAGDVSMGYDLIFSNQSNAQIESYGALSIISGENFEDNDLTLKTFGTGDVVVNAGGSMVLYKNSPELVLDSATTGDTDFWISATTNTNGTSDDKLMIGTGTTAGTGTLFTLTANGSLGIGTTAPSSTLDVTGTVTATGIKLPTGAGEGKVLTSDASGNATWAVPAESGTTIDGTPVGGNTVRYDGTSSSWVADSFLFNTGTSVGVGTTAPSTTLDVAGTVKATGLQITTNPVAGHVLTSDENGNATWQAPAEGGTNISGSTFDGQTARYNGTAWVASDFFFNNGTSLGIGTTAPSATLDLVSNVSTGTGALLSFDSLSEGTGLSVTSESNSFSTGTLAKIDWSPTLETIATGDLFSLNIGANGTLNGNLFAIYNNASPVFTVTQTGITSHVPHNFASSGDVSMAYDLIFTNDEASTIESYGPFSIVAGESFENNPLTLKTYGVGDIIMDLGRNLVLNSADTSIVFDTKTATDTDYWMGITNDGASDDDDLFIIGKGTTAGSNPLLSVNGSGYLGVGTTAPSQALDVVGNLKLSGYIVDSLGDAGTEGQILARTATGVDWIDAPTSGTTIGGSAISGSTVRYNGTAWTADNLLFNNGTTIGIGTTAPDSTLHISGTQTIEIPDGTKHGLYIDASMLQPVDYGYTTANALLIEGVPSAETYGSKATLLKVTGSTRHDDAKEGMVRFDAHLKPTLMSGSASNLYINTTADNVEGAGYPIDGFGIYNTYSSPTPMDENTGIYNYVTVGGNYSNAIDTWGLYNRVSNTNSTNQGIRNTYGGYFNTTGSANGTSTTYGLYTTASGADTNYALYSAAGTNYLAGNLGIGTTAPTEEFEVVGDGKFSGTVYATAFSSNSPLQLQTAGTTRIYVDDATGNVGIGTTAPGSYTLNINGSTNITSLSIGGAAVDVTAAQLNLLGDLNSTLTAAELNILDGATLSTAELNFLDGTTVTAGGLMYGNGTNLTQDAANLYWDASNKRLGVGTNNPQASLDIAGASSVISNTSGDMTISSADDLILSPTANVGIGTTAPSKRLEVANTNDSSTGTIRLTGNQSSNSGNIGTLDFYNYYASSALSVAQISALRGYADFKAGQLAFQTSAASTGTLSIKMLIDEAGRVGIGTTGPTDKLTVAGDIRVGTGTTGCVMDADGTAIAGSCSSDERLKQNITPLGGILDKLIQLEPVTYKWRQSEFPEDYVGSRTEFGLIAQDVEEVFPSLVNTKEDGYMTVDYGPQLTMYTIQAIKELNEKIDNLSMGINTPETTQSTQSEDTSGSDLLAQMNTIFEQFKDFIAALGLSATEENGLMVNADMNVLGNTTLGKVTITGETNIGLMKLDGLDNTIKVVGGACVNDELGTKNSTLCEAQALKIMNNLAGNVDFFDGAIVLEPDGTLKTKTLVAEKVIANEVSVKGASEGQDSSIGSGTLTAGTTEVIITNTKVKANSKVFITATSSTNGQALIVKEKVEGTSFTVSVDQSFGQDINFDWWIVNVE